MNINLAYREATQGAVEPDYVVTPWSAAQKLLSPEEVEVIEKFRSEHLGKNWSLDRKTLVVTEEPYDEREHVDEAP